MSTSISQSQPAFQQTLEVYFEAMYHGHRSFRDFLEIVPENQVTHHQYTKAGHTRTLTAPAERLKGLLEFIRLFVVDFLPVDTRSVFSYRKGVSVLDAVLPHAKNCEFLLLDIADFFPSITRARVKDTLLGGLSASPVSDLGIWIERISDLVTLEDSVPQGYSTSPGLSNAVLYKFDNRLREYCESASLTYTRYSDDIIVSGATQGAIGETAKVVARHLQEEFDGEFNLNAQKAKFFHNGLKVKLLGMVLLPNGKISVDRELKNRIEVDLHFYLTDRDKFLQRNGDASSKAESKLSGRINYANSIDPRYLDKLRKKFGVTVVDYFLHRSF